MNIENCEMKRQRKTRRQSLKHTFEHLKININFTLVNTFLSVI